MKNAILRLFIIVLLVDFGLSAMAEHAQRQQAEAPDIVNQLDPDFVLYFWLQVTKLEKQLTDLQEKGSRIIEKNDFEKLRLEFDGLSLEARILLRGLERYVQRHGNVTSDDFKLTKEDIQKARNKLELLHKQLVERRKLFEVDPRRRILSENIREAARRAGQCLDAGKVPNAGDLADLRKFIHKLILGEPDPGASTTGGDTISLRTLKEIDVLMRRMLEKDYLLNSKTSDEFVSKLGRLHNLVTDLLK